MNEVYILIPIYLGLNETRDCLESVARYSFPYRCVIIDDCTPDPAIADFLDAYAKEHENALLIRNPVNLGFVKSANIGFRIFPEKDVIILNSDTIVTSHWVEKLRRWAYCSRNVATVTPFSNNATILSYPRMCKENALPDGLSADEINALFEDVCLERPGGIVELPTGIGFCLYIRREFLSKAGDFDESLFEKGYGEENEFSLRCSRFGGRHLAALDAYIYHKDGVSFGKERKEAGTARAMETLNGMCPDYDRTVQSFMELDPLRHVRTCVDFLRFIRCPRPGVLLVEHGLGGGVLKHINDLAVMFIERGYRPFGLVPYEERGVVLRALGEEEDFSLMIDDRDWLSDLIFLLNQLKVVHLHFHHTAGYPDGILDLSAASGFSYDVTIHDYYTVCPRITGFLPEADAFCGLDPNNDCEACLSGEEALQTLDIQKWRSASRSFLKRARKVIVPSHAAAGILNRFFPDIKMTVQYHPERYAFEARKHPNTFEDRLHVGLIGGLSPQKGRKIMEDCVRLSRQEGLPLHWTLIGVTDKEECHDEEDFVITGPYEQAMLPALIEQHGINVVLLPALWPETYSFVLSEAWLLGCPVIAPDVGAFSERMAAVDAGMLLPSPVHARSILDLLMELVNDKGRFEREASRADSYNPRSFEDYWAEVFDDLPAIESLPDRFRMEADPEPLHFSRRTAAIIARNEGARIRHLAMSTKKELTLTQNHVNNLVSIQEELRRGLNAAIAAGEAQAKMLSAVNAELSEVNQSLLSKVKGLEESVSFLHTCLDRYHILAWINLKTSVKHLITRCNSGKGSEGKRGL
jgi:O-antigen biosynthesis protein